MPELSFEELMLQAGVMTADLPASSAPVQTPDPVPVVNPEPPKQASQDFFTAVFQGMYYKPTGKNMDKAPFKVECRVPMAWLKRNDYIPVGFFKAFLAPRLMPVQYPDYNGCETVYLVSTSGLPKELPDQSFLHWTAELSVLEQFARSRSLPIKFELYADAHELRRAILRCIQCINESSKGGGIDVFLKEQDMRNKGKNKVKRDIEAELKAIGY